MDALVVTGDAELRERLARDLGERGCAVTTATVVAEAVELSERQFFHLIVLEAGAELADAVHRLRAVHGPVPSVLLGVMTGPQMARGLPPGEIDDLLLWPAESDSLGLRLDLAAAQVRRRGGRVDEAPFWERREILKLLVETMNEGLGVRDRRGTIVYANRRLCEMLDYRREELLGKPIRELVSPEYWDHFMEQIKLREAGNGSTYELVMVGRGGRRIETIQSGQPLYDDQGHFLGSFAVITDMTQIKRLEHRLRLTQFSVDYAADAVFWLGRDGRVQYANRSACELLGYPQDQVLQMTIHQLTPDFTAETFRRTWLRARQRGSLRVEDWVLRKDGSRLPVEVTVNYLEYEGREILIAVARDISDRRRSEEQLRQSALHDPLTGLPNRTLFMDRLEHCFERARRESRRFAVLFIDVDRLKMINDSLGHPAGDALLCELARRIERCVRRPDTVARVGGDEFLVLLEDTRREEAEAVSRRLLEELKEPVLLADQEVMSSVSIGIGISEGRDGGPQDIVRDADLAMYQAKAQGGGAVVVFDPGLHLAAVSRLELETDLRRAFKAAQFELHYQPILGPAGRRPIGVEALLRWYHPKRGLVTPEEFLPAAEETGLITPLTWWVLEEACQHLAMLREGLSGDPPLRLWVNLSGRVLGHQELAPRLVQALAGHGLGPKDLTLEVTESVALGSPTSTLEALTGSGVGLCIDDFGAGQSTLQDLSQLPVKAVKIDRSFVQRIPQDRKTLEIVRSIIALVHNLGIQAVGEGVELAEQLELLQSLGCDGFQGFLFGRPLDVRGTLRALRTREGRR
jgi:diguanylate cyclase (GGDEF)-like protein/PAS domain S-box-containing protein